MEPDFLVTHSGGFHADELLSSVILTRLFREPASCAAARRMDHARQRQDHL